MASENDKFKFNASYRISSVNPQMMGMISSHPYKMTAKDYAEISIKGLVIIGAYAGLWYVDPQMARIITGAVSGLALAAWVTR
ncbi:MAG: hypothetical protein V3R25_10200 [Nitrosomonadaceae bacterium]